jgi:exocyst complex component 2
MEILHNEIRERALSDAKWRQIQQGLNHSVSVSIRIIIV